MIKLFDGSDNEPEQGPDLRVAKTPCELLMAFTLGIERKRIIASGTPLQEMEVPQGFTAVRIDKGEDDDPINIACLGMQSGTTALVFACSPPEDNNLDCVVTAHDGEKGRVMKEGAFAAHLPMRITFALACQMLENVLPFLSPRVRAAADALLLVVRK